MAPRLGLPSRFSRFARRLPGASDRHAEGRRPRKPQWLGLAQRKGAGFFLASTSEVYGDPQVHPQPESYWGNVNPIGPRSVYDEAKRFAEAVTMAYHRVHGLPVRIIRIFNTYGPRMRRHDGRAVPNFIDQALTGRTDHGLRRWVTDPFALLRRRPHRRDLARPPSRPHGTDQPRQHRRGPVRHLAELIRSLANSPSPSSSSKSAPSTTRRSGAPTRPSRGSSWVGSLWSRSTTASRRPWMRCEMRRRFGRRRRNDDERSAGTATVPLVGGRDDVQAI